MFYGFGCTSLFLEDFVKGTVFPNKKDSTRNIFLVHYPIGEKATPNQLAANTLDFPNWDIGFAGDIHEGFKPIILKSGCLFGNPGSIIRKTKLDKYRIPKIFEINYSQEFKIKEISIPCIPKEKCFVKELEEIQNSSKTKTSTKKYEKKDTLSMLKDINEQLGFNDKVLKYVSNKWETYEKNV